MVTIYWKTFSLP